MILCVFLVFILLTRVSAEFTACDFQHVDPIKKNGCWSWDLSSMSSKTWTMKSKYSDQYLVGNPCGSVQTSNCSVCAHAAPSPAIQMDSAGCSGKRCIPLATWPPASSQVDLLDTSNPKNGLVVTYDGGEGGRKFVYRFRCNTSASSDSGPEGLIVEDPGFTYTVTWDTPFACGKFDPTMSTCHGNQTVALPTKAQIDWMELEIGAIGHFNMGTFQSCGIGSNEGMSVPPPETFAPTDVDTDSWAKALHSFGAKRAVLVVSHGCGFNTFPSNTAFPEFDFVYNYSVKHSPWKDGKGDVAKDFVASCKKYGIRPGFYHGAVNNAFLNVHGGRVGKPSGIPGQAVITQDQYHKILLANLKQLWSSYDDIAEVWFDGGLPAGVAGDLWALHQKIIPNAVAFQGPNVGSQPNLIRWCGTESGHVSDPYWSAINIKVNQSSPRGQGAPDGNVFAPAETDTCFQGSGSSDDNISGPYGGCWFYNHGMHPKSLSELVSIYHDSIGKNTFLLLDWTPMPNGTMRADHVKRYQEFGDWLTTCYAVPIVQTISFDAEGSAQLVVPTGHEVDRIMLQEDQSNGQRILSFTVNVSIPRAHSTSFQLPSEVITGQSIGNKHIAFLSKAYSAGTVLTLTLTDVIGKAKMKRFSAYNCSRTPTPTGCAFIRNFEYKVVHDITIKVIDQSSPTACCDACRSLTTCAVFVLDVGAKKCTLLSANQGGEDKTGFLSGSPH